MSVENSFALLSASLPPEPAHAEASKAPSAPSSSGDELATGVDPELAQQARLVEQACREPLHRLIEEVELCRRYYEMTFQGRPVNRLIFVGGEARQKSLCQHLARSLGLAAQVGDPMLRLAKASDLGIESGIDRRQPQPGWAVAIGLSMGPAAGAHAAAQAAAMNETSKA
jgi:Tfp pilus assembly PilM family ATPase